MSLSPNFPTVWPRKLFGKCNVFPVEPRRDEFDDRGCFAVRDTKLTSTVLPLFSFNPQASEERPIGHGTAFRIDPWSRCATAFHVIEDLLEVDSRGESVVLKPDVRLVALDVPGIALGTPPIPEDAWRTFAGSFALAGIESPPFESARVRNVTELSAIRIRPPAPCPSGTPFLPLDFRRWHPQIGERVVALGYADLDRAQDEAPDDRPIDLTLYGSFGRITDIEKADGGRGRPWPMIRVEAEWPGGMSGGPVINEAGQVIGVVSTGLGHVGSATFFSGWNIPERIFRSIDPDNPGRFMCFAAFDASGEVVRAGQNAKSIEQFARANGLTDLGIASVEPFSGDSIRQLVRSRGERAALND